MSDDKNPREFWIMENRCSLPTRVAYSEFEMMNQTEINDDVVCVIEKSAYTALQAEVEQLKDREAKLVEALESISRNSCCGTCQEAKLVALAALEANKAAKDEQ